MAYYGEHGRRKAHQIKYCITCGRNFTGRGVYCYHHKPSNKVLYDTRGNPLHQDDYYHDRFRNDALIPRNRNLNITRMSPNMIFSAASNFFRPLITSKHINGMRFTNSGDFFVEPNNEVEQCSTCKSYFSCHERLRLHKEENSSGCEEHEICFPSEDEFDHGMTYKHDRCFVKGCRSMYRSGGCWKARVIRKHVYKYHALMDYF